MSQLLENFVSSRLARCGREPECAVAVTRVEVDLDGTPATEFRLAAIPARVLVRICGEAVDLEVSERLDILRFGVDALESLAELAETWRRERVRFWSCDQFVSGHFKRSASTFTAFAPGSWNGRPLFANTAEVAAEYAIASSAWQGPFREAPPHPLFGGRGFETRTARSSDVSSSQRRACGPFPFATCCSSAPGRCHRWRTSPHSSAAQSFRPNSVTSDSMRSPHGRFPPLRRGFRRAECLLIPSRAERSSPRSGERCTSHIRIARRRSSPNSSVACRPNLGRHANDGAHQLRHFRRLVLLPRSG